MELVQHRLGPRPAAPITVVPHEGTRVDHLAGTVHAVRLVPRGGIGNHEPTVNAELVGTPHRCGNDRLEPARFGRGEVDGAAVVQDLDPMTGRCPQAEPHAPVAHELRTERHGVASAHACQNASWAWTRKA